MSCSICMYLHFFSGLPGALCCLLSFFLLTLFLLGFIESIYFVLKLDGIFKRLASRVMSLRLPPIQKDRCIRRNSHTEVGAGESGTSLSLKPCCAQSLVKLTHTHTHTQSGDAIIVTHLQGLKVWHRALGRALREALGKQKFNSQVRKLTRRDRRT